MKNLSVTKIGQQIPESIKAIINKIHQENWDIFLVGGAVRDLFLGQKTFDFDFATSAPPEEIQKIFPHSFYDNNFGTVKIPQPNGDIEITTFRRESGYQDKRHPDQVSWGKTIEEDVSRRDFTINTLALGLRASRKNSSLELVDVFAGREDITQKLIRAVGDPQERFQEDALRLLRAIRLAAQLGFTIEPKTKQALAEQASLIKNVSGERIRDELFKILPTNRVEMGFELARETGLMNYILPELVAGYQMEQKGHHLWEVWKHSLLSAQYCPSKDPIIRLAALIHDIGKPVVVDDSSGERTFHNHEVVGANMARKIAQRLRLSKKDTEGLVTLVRYHQFSVSEQQTDKAIKRFIRKVGKENIADMLALRTGDRLGSGAKETSWRTEQFKQRLIEVQKEPFSIKDLKIDGREVMKTLNIPPGPKVGQILNQLFDEVENGKIENKKAALLNEVKKF
jgi:putative nucleotidyltransferase with HDIG domain